MALAVAPRLSHFPNVPRVVSDAQWNAFIAELPRSMQVSHWNYMVAAMAVDERLRQHMQLNLGAWVRAMLARDIKAPPPKDGIDFWANVRGLLEYNIECHVAPEVVTPEVRGILTANFVGALEHLSASGTLDLRARRALQYGILAALDVAIGMWLDASAELRRVRNAATPEPKLQLL